MLDSLNQSLLNDEINKIEQRGYPRPVKFNGDMNLEYFTFLLEKYDIIEYSLYWYDSDPLQCKDCKLEDRTCDNCNILNEWIKSGNIFTKCTWIDAFGSGLWGRNQNQANKEIIQFMKALFNNRYDFNNRIFITEIEGYVYLFFYLRDLSYNDLHIILKRKE